MKTSPAPAATKRRHSDEDLPLINDIRLLGRILGDVIREQEGEDSYALVEKIRMLRERLGITSFMLGDVETALPIVERLAGS